MDPDKVLKDLEAQGKNSVHFIGIGGIGMAALARWFLSQKWNVSGSDLTRSELTAELAKEGVRFTVGHQAKAVGRVQLVIRSQAIQPSNSEYAAARAKRLPIFTYPELVGVLTRRYETIAIAGAHGKSTTTALMALVAESAKLDPTVIIGTKLKEFNGSNFRKGKSDWLILEADEFGRAFLNYSPRLLIVTNIDREHLDIYRNIADIKSAFMKLFCRVMPKGALILNADNKNLISLRSRIEKLAVERKLKIYWYSSKDRIAKAIRENLKIPGAHNVSNALGVYTLARKVLGIPEDKITKTLSSFRGSWRRYDFKGSYKFAHVVYDIYDEYGHHPTEVVANLTAYRDKFPDHTLICVFQPHQADRLKRLFSDFKKAFDIADVLLLFPEYKVAGREESPTPFTSRALALAIQKRNPKSAVTYVEDLKSFSRETIQEALDRTDFAKKKAVVVMMGAGSIVQYTKNLLSI